MRITTVPSWALARGAWAFHVGSKSATRLGTITELPAAVYIEIAAQPGLLFINISRGRLITKAAPIVRRLKIKPPAPPLRIVDRFIPQPMAKPKKGMIYFCVPARNSQKLLSIFPKKMPKRIGIAKSRIDVGVISDIPRIERVK